MGRRSLPPGCAPSGKPQFEDAGAIAGRRVFERNACMNCHAVAGTPADGRFGPDLTHLMSRATIAAGAADNTHENLRLWIQNPGAIKPGSLMPAMKLSDADLDAVVSYMETLALEVGKLIMSSNVITVPVGQTEARPWVDELHQWLATVDHKRLGILYIVSALMFLVIGGVEALIIRIQLMHSHNHFVSPEVFNQMFTMHGTTMIFFVAMPVLFGFANYLVPIDDRCARYGFSALECIQFLAVVTGGTSSLFQLSRRERPVRRWKRAGRGLVVVRAIGRPSVLAWS